MEKQECSTIQKPSEIHCFFHNISIQNAWTAMMSIFWNQNMIFTQTVQLSVLVTIHVCDQVVSLLTEYINKFNEFNEYQINAVPQLKTVNDFKTAMNCLFVNKQMTHIDIKDTKQLFKQFKLNNYDIKWQMLILFQIIYMSLYSSNENMHSQRYILYTHTVVGIKVICRNMMRFLIFHKNDKYWGSPKIIPWSNEEKLFKEQVDWPKQKLMCEVNKVKKENAVLQKNLQKLQKDYQMLRAKWSTLGQIEGQTNVNPQQISKYEDFISLYLNKTGQFKLTETETFESERLMAQYENDTKVTAVDLAEMLFAILQ